MSIDYIASRHDGVPEDPARVVPMGDASSIREAISRAYPTTQWLNHWLSPSVGLVGDDRQSVTFRLIYERMNLDLHQLYLREGREPTEEEIMEAHHGTGQIMSVAIQTNGDDIAKLLTMCHEQTWALWDLQTGQLAQK